MRLDSRSGAFFLENLGSYSFQPCSASVPRCSLASSFWCGACGLTSARRVTSGHVPSKPLTTARAAGPWPGIRADAVISALGWSGSHAAVRTGRTATALWGWPALPSTPRERQRFQKQECVKVSRGVIRWNAVCVLLFAFKWFYFILFYFLKYEEICAEASVSVSTVSPPARYESPAL